MTEADHELPKWKELPANTLDVMKNLGDFSPTTNAAHRMVKGYIAQEDGEDGRTYWDSGDLREIAAACNRVADWLDARAVAEIGEQP